MLVVSKRCQQERLVLNHCLACRTGIANCQRMLTEHIADTQINEADATSIKPC